MSVYSLSDSSASEPNTPVRPKRQSRAQWVSSTDDDSSEESVVRNPRSSRRQRVASSSDSSDSSIARPSKKKICRASGMTNTLDTCSDYTDSEVEKLNQQSKKTVQKDDENTSSDSDGEERCIICFKTLRPPVAQPSNCSHTFHSECLLTWSKTSNTCPIDRVKYTEVHIRGPSGFILSKRSVATPPPQDHNSNLEPDDPTFCEVCNQHDRESEMLLCDRCEAGYHLDCLTPPLLEVPSGDWFCPDCSLLQNDIDDSEVRDIMSSAVILETRFRTRRERTPRIVPRTRAAQRVLNTIRQRANAQPSTSLGSTSRSQEPRRKKSRRKQVGSRYKVELVTTADGATVEVKVAIHTGRCKRKGGRKSKRKSRKSRNSNEGSRNYRQGGCMKEGGRVASGNNLARQPLDIFGTRPQLDYFSGCEAEDELEEDGGLGVLRRARTVGARGMAERKQIAAQLLASRPRRPRPVILSQSTPSTDVLSSILQDQERMYNQRPHTSSQNSSPERIPNILPNRSGGSLPVRKAPGSNSTNRGQAANNSESRNMDSNSQYYRGSVASYHSAPPLQPPPQPPFSRLYEDEDIDLYADIEPPTCRLAAGSLVPPPEPPALLLAMEGEDGGSSPEDTMLVIDDQREAYDPDEPTSPPSPDKPKDGGSTTCKSPNTREEIKDYPKVNMNLEDIRLPSPIENENDSECPNTVMYSKTSRSIARRDSTESTDSVQAEMENGVLTCSPGKESAKNGKSDVGDPNENEPNDDELEKEEENDSKNDEGQNKPLDEAQEVGDNPVTEKNDIDDKNIDEKPTVKTEETDDMPDKCIEADESDDHKEEDNKEVKKEEENENSAIEADKEMSKANSSREKEILDEIEEDDVEHTKGKDISDKSLQESPADDKKKASDDDKQNSLEKIDLMEDTSLGEEESETLNESQISRENIEADDESKRSPEVDDDDKESDNENDNDNNNDNDNENDNEKDPEGDVLVLGCEEADRDGLVDITDEEMSTYEKNWEMEKDKSGGGEKRVGLEGLETEAISECEDTLYDDTPAKPTAENSVGKEEGEIIAEEKVESIAWKKISKGTKERSYREKDSKEKNKENKKKEKKPKEKRKEIERYDVRKIISDKPKKRKTDEFGRDISNSRSRSTSKRSDERVKRRRSSRERRKSHSRGRSKTRSKSRGAAGGRSRGKSAVSPGKGRAARARSRSWSRTRGSSRTKRRLRSRSLRRDKPRERMKSKDRKRRRKSTSSCSSCSCSSCEREKRAAKKPAVVVPSKKPSVPRKGKTKKRDKTKEKSRKDPNRRRKAGSPVPSKEVFTSGDNILVSVNFKSTKSADGTRKKDGSRRKREEESRRRKDKSSKENHPMRSIVTTTVSVPPNMPRTKRKANKLNARNLKPVAIIDLDQSPFREQTPSPKEVIILSDSDSEDKRENDAPTIQTVTTGPKTPPEPHIKFIINPKPPLRNLSNPLLDSAEPEEREPDEEEPQEISHKGPNTPPEPPVPYDPFEPTKSRSPTPGPDTDVDRIPSPPPDMAIDGSPEQPKMASSPPKMILQHDSPKTPSPLQSPPPKPPEEVSVEKPKLPVYTPVMTTNCSDDGGEGGGGVGVGGGGGGGGDSPYSPGSSEGDDLFEPPLPQITSQTPVAKVKPRPIVPQKHTNTLKLTPSPLKKKPVKAAKNKGGSKKEIGIKLDEDQLKILDDLPNSAVEMQVKDKFLKKLNRQERVVEEVKLVLKPHYAKKHVTKDEYKDILRKAVPKICHSRSGEINPIKIQHLIEAYVKKYRHKKKKNTVGGILPLKPKQKQSMWC